MLFALHQQQTKQSHSKKYDTMPTKFQDLDPAGVSPEDRVNALRGYKAYVYFTREDNI
jgi:hypothetical protein